MTKPRIAIVEDDELIRDMISFRLNKAGFLSASFPSAESFWNRPKDRGFDLIILDMILPGLGGQDLLAGLKKEGDSTPVLILTVKDGLKDRLSAFKGGADDYLIKPFNLDELEARALAIIRRSQGKRHLPSTGMLIFGGYRLNIATRVSESNLGRMQLSEKEVELLRFLAAHSRRTLSRADILEEVWGMEVVPTPRTVDNFILRFRKLYEKKPRRPRHFVSVRGQGYRYEP